MKKYAFLLLVLFPSFAFAHEHNVFKVGNATYQVVIGSLNEPMTVDDKSGVDLRITKCADDMCAPTRGEDGDMDGPPRGTPVMDAASTLKVEVIAGPKKKTFDLAPQWGVDGGYKAVFFPTIATSLTYRVFGSLNSTPVDLSFTCRPEGAPEAEDSMPNKQLSEGVTHVMKGGGFGCPQAKEQLGFPEKAYSNFALSDDLGSATNRSLLALVLGVVALVMSILAYRRK